MSDIADQANDLAQHNLALALQNRAQVAVGPSAYECEECGEPIPEARRLALPGVQHCVGCKEIEDQKAKHYRRV